MPVLALASHGGCAARLLCIGAHPDDIEIGCGGTLLRLAADAPGRGVHWVVLTGSTSERAARRAPARPPSSRAAPSREVDVAARSATASCRSGRREVKDVFER